MINKPPESRDHPTHTHVRKTGLADVATRADPTSFLTTACFHCGFTTTGQLGCCGRCGRTTRDPDDVICSHCMRDLASKD
jgi:hypothetical protein